MNLKVQTVGVGKPTRQAEAREGGSIILHASQVNQLKGQSAQIL
jgi:hypothetical protein